MMLMLIARIVVLKKNDNTPCIRDNLRSDREVTSTSETWLVIPITNEKYEKKLSALAIAVEHSSLETP
jgi:hypothetical protein